MRPRDHMQDLEREIARCRRLMKPILDKMTLERLGAYLRDLERALEAESQGSVRADVKRPPREAAR
jgi:hypothetical protein